MTITHRSLEAVCSGPCSQLPRWEPRMLTTASHVSQAIRNPLRIVFPWR